MKINKSNLVEYVGMFISISLTVISFYAQSKDPQEAVLLFFILLLIIFLYFLVSWPIEYIINKIKMIEANFNKIEIISKDLNTIKEKIDFENKLCKLDGRISMIEQLFKMNKKGAIDPRWVLIILMILVFIIYLRAKGII